MCWRATLTATIRIWVVVVYVVVPTGQVPTTTKRVVVHVWHTAPPIRHRRSGAKRRGCLCRGGRARKSWGCGNLGLWLYCLFV